jgi:hypothetical protein
MEKLKLSKLLYLADRENFDKLGFFIFSDEHYSLKDGPICSNAIDGINGKKDKSIWGSYIVIDHAAGRVRCKSDFDPDRDTDALTGFERRIAEKLSEQFAALNGPQMCDWTHDNIREWIDPLANPSLTQKGRGSGRIKITPEAIEEALGVTEGKRNARRFHLANNARED